MKLTSRNIIIALFSTTIFVAVAAAVILSATVFPQATNAETPAHAVGFVAVFNDAGTSGGTLSQNSWGVTHGTLIISNGTVHNAVVSLTLPNGFYSPSVVSFTINGVDQSLSGLPPMQQSGNTFSWNFGDIVPQTAFLAVKFLTNTSAQNGTVQWSLAGTNIDPTSVLQVQQSVTVAGCTPVGMGTVIGDVHGANALLIVPPNACPVKVSFSSYQHQGTILPLENQVLFDNVTATYGPGTYNLGPLKLACNWQTDLYLGDVLTHLGPTGHAGFLLAADYVEHQTCAPPPPPQCISGGVTGTVHGGNATLVVPQNGCPVKVSFTSYEHQGTIVPFENQVLTDNITDTYGPGTHAIGPIRLACNWQTDLYLGPLQYPLSPSGHTGIIAFDFVEHQICQPQTATLTVIKHVVNNNGGTASAGNFTMTINGVTATGGNSFSGSESGVIRTVTTGSYNVTESSLAGYAQTSASAGCSGTIAAGETKTCTITNDDIPPQRLGCIDVVKETFDPNNNPVTPVAQFTFKLDGNTATAQNGSDGRAHFSSVSVGSHTVSEQIPSGWTQILVTPSGGTVNVPVGPVCAAVVFKNKQLLPPVQPAHLTVIKHVINSNGGSKAAADFTLRVKLNGADVSGSPAAGSDDGVQYTVSAGTYAVSEDGPPSGYTQTGISGDCDPSGAVTLAAGDNKTCTVTNHDAPAVLGCIDVVKETFGTNGSALTPVPQFTFKLDGNATVQNDSAGHARFNNVASGTHTVGEVLPDGWERMSTVPSDGQVSVSGSSTCSTVHFQNHQTFVPPITGCTSNCGGGGGGGGGGVMPSAVVVLNSNIQPAAFVALKGVVLSAVPYTGLSDTFGTLAFIIAILTVGFIAARKIIMLEGALTLPRRNWHSLYTQFLRAARRMHAHAANIINVTEKKKKPRGNTTTTLASSALQPAVSAASAEKTNRAIHTLQLHDATEEMVGRLVQATIDADVWMHRDALRLIALASEGNIEKAHVLIRDVIQAGKANGDPAFLNGFITAEAVRPILKPHFSI